MLRDAPFSGLYLWLFEPLKAWLLAHGVGRDAATVAGGLVAGAVASYMTQPFDVIKTRVQVQTGSAAQSTWRILAESFQV